MDCTGTWMSTNMELIMHPHGHGCYRPPKIQYSCWISQHMFLHRKYKNTCTYTLSATFPNSSESPLETALPRSVVYYLLMVWASPKLLISVDTFKTHTHTHIYLYMYLQIYIQIYICMHNKQFLVKTVVC